MIAGNANTIGAEHGAVHISHAGITALALSMLMDIVSNIICVVMT